MNNDFWTWLGRLSDSVSLILFCAGCLTYLNRENIRRWLTRNRFPKEVGHPLGNHIQFDALVFTEYDSNNKPDMRTAKILCVSKPH